MTLVEIFTHSAWSTGKFFADGPFCLSALHIRYSSPSVHNRLFFHAAASDVVNWVRLPWCLGKVIQPHGGSRGPFAGKILTGHGCKATHHTITRSSLVQSTRFRKHRIEKINTNDRGIMKKRTFYVSCAASKDEKIAYFWTGVEFNMFSIIQSEVTAGCAGPANGITVNVLTTC